MTNYILTPTGELYHSGIKGMKWGVRRFQNPDGTLTSAGKKRYKDDPEVVKAKNTMDAAKDARSKASKEYTKANLKYQLIPTRSNTEARKEKLAELKQRDKDYDNAKFKYGVAKEAARLRAKGYNPEKKSKHRLKLEEKYKELGLSDEEAQAAANKRIRTEKIIAASAGLSIAACVALHINNQNKKKIDGIIKAGEDMQRIEMQDTNGKLHDMFYVAKGDHDSKRYAGLLGMSRQQQTGEAYLMKLQASKDIKVASQEKAAEMFGDLYKNDAKFRKSVRYNVMQHFTGKNVVDPDNLSDRNIKKMYENFNAGLIDIKFSGSGADKKFYDKLKSAGYGAIQDINDMKFSGFNAKNPLIIFDNSGGNVMVKSMTKMDDQTSAGMIELGKATAERIMDKMPAISAAGLSVAAVSTYAKSPKSEYKPDEEKGKRD